MQEETNNSRATNVLCKSQDHDDLQRVVSILQSKQSLTLECILNKSQQCKLLKQDQAFLFDLFYKHSNLVIEMIEWLFTPEKIIKRKNVKPTINNLYAQPFLCRNFICGNYQFYSQMHKAARNNQIPITCWCDFLLVQNLNQDQIATSLGYFKDIFIPFVTHDYHPPSLSLCQSLQFGKNTEEIAVQNYAVLSIFSQKLIESLLKLTYIETVFILIFRLIISSLQQPSVRERGKQILRNLFRQMKNDDRIFCNMGVLFQQILKNLTNDKDKRVNVIVEILLQMKTAQNSIQRITQSFLTNQKSQKNLLQKEEEQQIVQHHLKMLTFIMSIFNKVAKEKLIQKPPQFTKNIEQVKQDLQQQQEVNQTSILSSLRNSSNQKSDLYNKLQQTIKLIFKNLPEIQKIVDVPQTYTICFSSGQNISPITLVKYAYFQLLLKSLKIQTQYNHLFKIDIDRLNLFPLIQRYLIENCWNNISQRVLQKIVKILVVNNYSFFKQNNMGQKKLPNGFIGFLIENFTSKDYMFLNTFRQTNKGYMYTLYKIAEAVAKQLDHNQSLFSLIDQFKPWEKFITNDLKNYEKRVFQPILHLDPIVMQQSNQNNEQINIQIDQIQPIKKLVHKYEENNINKIWLKQGRLKKKTHSTTQPNSDYKIQKNLHFDSFDHDHRNKKLKLQAKFQGRSSYPPLSMITEQKQFTSEQLNLVDNINLKKPINDCNTLNLNFKDIIKDEQQKDTLQQTKVNQKQETKNL